MRGLWIHWIRKTDPDFQKELIELYRTFYNLFVKCASEIVGSVAVAEEVVQDSMSEFLWSHDIYRLYEMDRECRVYYMRRVVCNRAITEYRKKKTCIPIEEVSSLLLEESHEEIYLRKEKEEIIQDAIMALPSKERMVMMLHLNNPEMSYSHMASILDISRKTVASRLDKAQKMLVKELKKRDIIVE